MRRPGVIGGYYLLTPLFFLVERWIGVPLRVPVEAVAVRVAWYAAAFLLGILCTYRPRAAPWVGMGESAVSLTLLVLGVLLPIWNAPDALLAGGGVPGQRLLLARSANLLLSGSVLVFAFHRAQRHALTS